MSRAMCDSMQTQPKTIQHTQSIDYIEQYEPRYRGVFVSSELSKYEYYVKKGGFWRNVNDTPANIDFLYVCAHTQNISKCGYSRENKMFRKPSITVIIWMTKVPIYTMLYSFSFFLCLSSTSCVDTEFSFHFRFRNEMFLSHYGSAICVFFVQLNDIPFLSIVAARSTL